MGWQASLSRSFHLFKRYTLHHRWHPRLPRTFHLFEPYPPDPQRQNPHPHPPDGTVRKCLSQLNKEQYVVICFWICIFDISNTLNYKFYHCNNRCDLLLNLYLWHIKHTNDINSCLLIPVVICFWICIFDISNTLGMFQFWELPSLWFAFEFVSLTYQTH